MGWFDSKPKDAQDAERRQIKANEGRNSKAQKELDAKQAKRKGFWDF